MAFSRDYVEIKNRAEERKRRLAELTNEVSEFAARGLNPATHIAQEKWEEFLRIATPDTIQNITERARITASRIDSDRLIEECTADMLPNQVHREVEELLRRNNLLLAAILKQLTRDL